MFRLIMADTTNISDLPLDQSTINQLVSGLQQTRGATQLPSRDIPMTTANTVVDEQVQPNYVPLEKESETMEDYIGNDYQPPVDKSNSLDDLYEELQTPLLIAVLFFLFQLPIFKKYLFQYFPVLFAIDGNMNINGYLFTSALFGIIYYAYTRLQSLL